MRSVESEAPITAAKAKKAIRAEDADILSMRNENMKMKASGAKATTHFKGVPYRTRPNSVRLMLPMRTTASAGSPATASMFTPRATRAEMARPRIMLL
jgi:hypothetical protein